MHTIAQIADEIIEREGGFVNDPDDPGGPTKHGVTIHTLRRLGLDLTGDDLIDISDVRAITKAQARDIFIDHYFHRPRIDALPRALQASVFDMYVNAGGNGVKVLQRLLGEFGFALAIDGVLGPLSIEAAHRAYTLAPEHLVDAYGIARREYYYALADRRPASRKYARRRDGTKGGWIKRAEEFISAHYHLSDQEHLQRTKQWA